MANTHLPLASISPRLSQPLNEMSAADLLRLQQRFAGCGNRRAERIVLAELEGRRNAAVSALAAAAEQLSEELLGL